MEDSRLHVISNFRILSLQISRRQIGLTVEPAFASALFGLLLASRVRGAGVPTAWTDRFAIVGCQLLITILLQ